MNAYERFHAHFDSCGTCQAMLPCENGAKLSLESMRADKAKKPCKNDMHDFDFRWGAEIYKHAKKCACGKVTISFKKPNMMFVTAEVEKHKIKVAIR